MNARVRATKARPTRANPYRVKEVASPFATGSGGPNFETRIQASFVVLMLAGGFSPCIRQWPIGSIALQARRLGVEIDDLVVEVGDPRSATKARLLVQIKHDIAFTRSNTAFAEVISAAWRDFQRDREGEPDTFAVVTGPLSSGDLELRTILEWARTSATAKEFFDKVELAKFSSSTKRQKLAAVRWHIVASNGKKAIGDDTFWTFLKRLHVMQYDLDIANSVNLAFLTCIIGQFGSAATAGIWAQLVEAVRTINQNAGTVSLETLPRDIVEAFQRKPPATFPTSLVSEHDERTAGPTSYPAELAIAQLVGSWNEAEDGDRDAISVLAGESYETFVTKLRIELQRPGTPLRYRGRVWRIEGRAEEWKERGSMVFDEHVVRLRSVIIDALTPDQGSPSKADKTDDGAK